MQNDGEEEGEDGWMDDVDGLRRRKGRASSGDYFWQGCQRQALTHDSSQPISGSAIAA